MYYGDTSKLTILSIDVASLMGSVCQMTGWLVFLKNKCFICLYIILLFTAVAINRSYCSQINIIFINILFNCNR